MEIIKSEQKNVQTITDIICDCCGESCKTVDTVIENDKRLDNGEKFYDFEYLKLEANWGFGSSKDGENWSAHICEKCVDTKFGFVKFKVK